MPAQQKSSKPKKFIHQRIFLSLATGGTHHQNTLVAIFVVSGRLRILAKYFIKSVHGRSTAFCPSRCRTCSQTWNGAQLATGLNKLGNSNSILSNASTYFPNIADYEDGVRI